MTPVPPLGPRRLPSESHEAELAALESMLPIARFFAASSQPRSRMPDAVDAPPRAEADLLATFERHMAAELAGDLEATMETMTDAPFVNHVPVRTGGVGRDGVRAFYRDHLVGRFFPPDVEVHSVSRTVGADRVVEELVLTFTHTAPVDWMLPDVPPTGRRVEAAVVVVVGFEGGRIAYERIYWDQASVLVQLGLLDPAGLPVSGADSARKVLDPALPARTIGRARPVS